MTIGEFLNGVLALPAGWLLIFVAVYQLSSAAAEDLYSLLKSWWRRHD